MGEYKTRQRELLIAYLMAHSEVPVTAEEICADKKISRSAIYRNLAQMSERGEVRRFADESGKTTRYQYVEKANQDRYLYLQCSSCGKIISMDTELWKHMRSVAAEKYGFRLNQREVVFPGVCEECVKKEGSNKK